jgi:hypothetical protein
MCHMSCVMWGKVRAGWVRVAVARVRRNVVGLPALPSQPSPRTTATAKTFSRPSPGSHASPTARRVRADLDAQVLRTGGNPHEFLYMNGGTAVNERGVPIQGPLSVPVSWDKVRRAR